MSSAIVSLWGRLPFPGNPPCPHWEVQSTPQGRPPFPGNQPFPCQEAPSAAPRTYLLLAKTFRSSRRTIPKECTFSPLGSSLSSSGETLPSQIFYLLLNANSPKAKQYFEAKVISIGIVSKDEMELFDLSRLVKIFFIPNVYILFNPYHGCILCKPPSNRIHP